MGHAISKDSAHAARLGLSVLSAATNRPCAAAQGLVASPGDFQRDGQQCLGVDVGAGAGARDDGAGTTQPSAQSVLSPSYGLPIPPSVSLRTSSKRPLVTASWPARA